MKNNNASSFSYLLNPSSVAIIGASDDKFRIGGKPINYMLDRGYSGRILPVNPNRSLIQGLPAFASIEALPEVPEIAIVAVAAAAVPGVIEELAKLGTKCAIVFSSGFAEVGESGAVLEAQMVANARAHGMRVLGPNSLGVVNPRNGFFGSFVTSVELGMPLSGTLGIVSQSGAYGGHLLAAATAARIGLSAVVMTGNESDLSLGEIVQGLVEDDATHVIALYSEGIREGSGFMAALEAARLARKPVVMMKVGRSAVGSAAAQSHTASIAGNDAVIDVVLSEFGVVRASTTEQMLDIARLATRRIFPVNNALGIVSISGGAGVIASDAAFEVGLPVPEMPVAAQARLKHILPFAAPRNPVDVTAQFLNDLSLLSTFMEAVLTEGGYPSVFGFFSYTAGAPSIAPRLRAQLKSIRERYPERLFVLCVLGSTEQIRGYEDDGFSVFEDPTRAIVAIEAMGRFGEAFARQNRKVDIGNIPVDLPFLAPNEAQAKVLLASAGIASAQERVCVGAEQAGHAASTLGFPVVMKIVSADIAHKSDMGGVLLDVANEGAAIAGFNTLMARARSARPDAKIDGVLVAKQLTGGVECLLGIHRDPVFGPVAMFGLGGVFVEILNDVVMHRCPFDEVVAQTMIRSIKGAPLLLGARGKPPVDILALAKMLSDLSKFAIAAGPRLLSVDLNPVMALPVGQGAWALDAVVEVTS
jgi:acetate---CoA ligase (ADP-forming)